MSTIVRTLLATGLALASLAATAETVYRCGTSYSSAPCAGAKAIETESAPSAAAQTEAREVAMREKRLAGGMARGRQVAEAAHPPALAGSLGPARPVAAVAPAKSPAKKSGKKKHPGAQPDRERDFVASVPRVRKTKG